MHEIKTCKKVLKRLAIGPNLASDISGLTLGKDKGFTWQA